MTPCSLKRAYQRFGGRYFVRLHEVEAACSCETLIPAILPCHNSVSQSVTRNIFAGAHYMLTDRNRDGRLSHDVGSGAGRPDAAVSDAGSCGARLQHDSAWGRRSSGLRLPADRALHVVRHQDTERPRELQWGQVHRLRHVHNVRHLDCLRPHLLWQRLQGSYLAFAFCTLSYRRRLSQPCLKLASPKVYTLNGVKIPHIIRFSSRKKWIISFGLWPFCPPEEEHSLLTGEVIIHNDHMKYILSSSDI